MLLGALFFYEFIELPEDSFSISSLAYLASMLELHSV
jgi:hypothetical protein